MVRKRPKWKVALVTMLSMLNFKNSRYVTTLKIETKTDGENRTFSGFCPKPPEFYRDVYFSKNS